MNKQHFHPGSATSIWRLLDRLAETFNQPLPLAQLVTVVNEILLDALDVEAIWFVTLPPLPVLACGVIRTPTPLDPQAKVTVLDNVPPTQSNELAGYLLGRVENSQAPFFLPPDHTCNRPDPDLGDVLFRVFEIVPTAIVPLRNDQRLLGALIIGQRRADGTAFSPESQDLLAFLGKTVAHNLYTHYFVKEADRQAQRSRLISQVLAALNTGRGLDDTAKILHTQLGRLFKFDHASLALLDSSQKLVHQWYISPFGSTEAKVISLESSRLVELMEGGQSFLEFDITQRKSSPRSYPDDEILLAEGVKAQLLAPLAIKERPFGSLTLGSRQAGRYTLADLELLDHLAPQIAVTLEKAQLLDILERHNNDLQLLNQFGARLNSTTRLERIFETTLNMLPRIVPADVHGVLLINDDEAMVGAAVPYNFARIEEVKQDILNKFMELRDSDSPLTVAVSTSIAGNMPVKGNWTPTDVKFFPILGNNSILGLIYVSSSAGSSLEDEHFKILSLVVSQVSVAAANATLFHQVEQQHARLRAILDSTTDAVLVVDRNGKVALDNPAAHKVLGVTESQVGGVLAERTRVRALVDLFNTVRQGGESTGELQLDDGRTFYANLSPVTIDEVGVIGWVATMQDVSHFKALDDLKSEFVNTVSHDLRAPLANILMALSLITQVGEINEDQNSLLSVIENRVNSMAHFIDDLLDIGKIEAGIDMKQESCNVSLIVNEVVDALSPEIKDKALVLIVDLEPNLPLIHGNPTRIRQVIYNLVGNALKYTLAGQVAIKARVDPQALRIEVKDTGIGIPPHEQPFVFEKFYRVHDEQTLEIKGTGLGLAIAKSIVEHHHGRIWLDSVQGKGSIFTVMLPLHPELPWLPVGQR